MPTGERVRYTLSAVIPRNNWREPLTQLRAQRDAMNPSSRRERPPQSCHNRNIPCL